jgi:hypothetical protein
MVMLPGMSINVVTIPRPLEKGPSSVNVPGAGRGRCRVGVGLFLRLEKLFKKMIFLVDNSNIGDIFRVETQTKAEQEAD